MVRAQIKPEVISKTNIAYRQNRSHTTSFLSLPVHFTLSQLWGQIQYPYLQPTRIRSTAFAISSLKISMRKDYSRLRSRISLLLKMLRDPFQLYATMITLLLAQAR
ncbi:MAG: hypothetical protein ACI90A_001458 [Shewanella sp.]|jgi:hypothetical protein